MFGEDIREKRLDKDLEEKLKDALEGGYVVHLMKDINTTPYLKGFEIRLVEKYNPNYGDNKICKCGHSYYRHFDTYEDMEVCGCKYCVCGGFEEKAEER